MKMKFYWAYVFLLFASFMSAQTNPFDYSTWTLNKVTFYEPAANPNHWVKIFEDPQPDSGGPIITPPMQLSGNQSTIAWESGGSTKPVAYVSGNYGTLSVEFSSTCISSTTVYIRGEGSDGYDIFWTVAYLNASGNYQIIPTDFCRFFEEDKVRGYKDFKIDWYISPDPLISRGRMIGTTTHPLYVTHKGAQNLPVSNGNPIIYHSYLFISCIAAHTQNMDIDIMEYIYGEFTDKKVYKYDSQSEMEYWGPNTPLPPQSNNACFTAAALLAYNNATCMAWADLLIQLGYTHGITSQLMTQVTYNDYILSPSDNQKLDGDVMAFFGTQATNVNYLYFSGSSVRADFFVKEWNLSNTVPFVMNDWHNIASGITPIEIVLINNNEIKIEEITGAAGQGNPDPRSEFENHFIVKYNHMYFDPSYGSAIAPDANAWEFKALHGFGSILMYNHNGTSYLINWVGHLNDNTLQSNVNP